MKKIDKIALLIPTRNRPNSIKHILEEYKIYGNGYIDFVIGVDEDDEYIGDYVRLANDYNVILYIAQRKRLGPTLNDMSVKYAKKYFALGFIGDDMRPRTEGWDGKIMSSLQQLKTGIVHGDDGHWGKDLATQVFMTSDIVQTLGYMVPPGMIHMYLDNFWSEFAREINKFVYRGDILIEHLHPAWGKAPKDSLYEETNTNERMNSDRLLYEKYKDEYFDADARRVKEYISLMHKLDKSD
jgi:hypothetical protein